MKPRLFHFSEDPTIGAFAPRPVRVPSPRALGSEWLNGPLVWAIAEPHEFLYLFPRDCPRILVWRRDGSSATDADKWLGDDRGVAFIESAWLDRLRSAAITRYELAPETFEDLADAGMWVSRQPAEIVGRDRFTDMPAALAARGVRLTVLDSLVPLRDLWQTSLAVSGIRLRNAQGWTA